MSFTKIQLPLPCGNAPITTGKNYKIRCRDTKGVIHPESFSVHARELNTEYRIRRTREFLQADMTLAEMASFFSVTVGAQYQFMQKYGITQEEIFLDWSIHRGNRLKRIRSSNRMAKLAKIENEIRLLSEIISDATNKLRANISAPTKRKWETVKELSIEERNRYVSERQSLMA